MYGLPLETASFVVTGYMLCGIVGLLLGGFVAARAARLERTIGVCLAAAGALLALVGTGWLPGRRWRSASPRSPASAPDWPARRATC